MDNFICFLEDIYLSEGMLILSGPLHYFLLVKLLITAYPSTFLWYFENKQRIHSNSIFCCCCYGRCQGLVVELFGGGMTRMNLMLTIYWSLPVFLRARRETSGRKSYMDRCRVATTCQGTFWEVTSASTWTTSLTNVYTMRNIWFCCLCNSFSHIVFGCVSTAHWICCIKICCKVSVIIKGCSLIQLFSWIS